MLIGIIIAVVVLMFALAKTASTYSREDEE